MALTSKSDVAQAIADTYHAEWGRIVAILIRLVGDFDLAEEAAQDIRHKLRLLNICQEGDAHQVKIKASKELRD